MMTLGEGMIVDSSRHGPAATSKCLVGLGMKRTLTLVANSIPFQAAGFKAANGE